LYFALDNFGVVLAKYHLTRLYTPEYASLHVFIGGDLMEPRYRIGQKVMVKPVKDLSSSARDSDIEQYAGQIGIVIDYYWLRPSAAEVFYIYTVKIGDDEKEVALHEDEMEDY